MPDPFRRWFHALLERRPSDPARANVRVRAQLYARLQELAARDDPQWPRDKRRRAARIATALMLHEAGIGAYTLARGDVVAAGRRLATAGARDATALELAEAARRRPARHG